MYSFGIDNNWKFTDAMKEDFKCETHAFDPNLYEEEEGERHCCSNQIRATKKKEFFWVPDKQLIKDQMVFSFTKLVLERKMETESFRYSYMTIGL